MPQSLASVHLHAVFSTKDRRPWLKDEKFRVEVYDFMSEISNRLGCPLVAIGGVEDHLHLLTRFSRTMSMADWMKEVKSVSSTFIKERIPEFYWQSGYGIFGVDSSAFQPVVAYIRNQEQHHQEVSFQDEFRRLMVEHGIEWDERYVWD